MIDEEKRAFQDLMSRLREGSEEAAWELVEKFGPHIRHVVRERLTPRLRSAFDSDDFVQAVWVSMVRMERQRENDLDDPRRFVNLLSAMARNKVIDQLRRRSADSFDDSAADADSNGAASTSALDRRVDSARSTPSQYAIAREQWYQMIAQKPPRTREILKLRIAGLSYREIAERQQVNERTVRRVVAEAIRTFETRSA